MERRPHPTRSAPVHKQPASAAGRRRCYASLPMERFRALAGWLPAVILPAATLDQLVTILRSGSGENVSAVTWLLFLLANLGALFLGRPANRIAVVQMALAFGLTAALDVAIVAVILAYRS